MPNRAGQAGQIPKMETAPHPTLRLLGRVAQIVFIFFLTFFFMAMLVMNLSPGRIPLREPSLSKPNLKLSRQTDFTIGIFSDLHFGEEEHGWGIDQDINSTEAMRSILKNENLQLVVLNGDLITGEDTFRENSSAYVDQIVKPMLERRVPWASTYGNHDAKFNLSREELFKADKGYDLSYTNSMGWHLPGITNYYILVEGIGPDPAAVLWFFDSRGGSTLQGDPDDLDDIPNWVAPETAKWFTKTHNELQKKYGRALPSIAFVHIPPHVFLEAQRSELDPTRFPGLNADVPLSIEGEGSDDSAFVKALLAADGLHSIYVGHDHGNSWCSTWPEKGLGSEAPFLCFSKHTGYGGYGAWNRGARIIKLSFFGGDGDDEMTVETWVRMEDGNVVTRVSLNETYGVDKYPTDTGE